MNKIIDCLFIGHNEMEFQEYEKEVRKMGLHSRAYADLNLNFIWYDNKPYSAADTFNLFYLNGGDDKPAADLKPLSWGENFSNTIAYLGTFLHRRGLTFDFVNYFRDQKEELAKKLSEENILTIGITTTLYISAFPILEIIDFIRRYNRTAKIVTGGPFIATQCRIMDSNSLEYLFDSIGADFYINSSEGEATLVKLINALKNNQPLEEINNLYFKSNQGYTATPSLIENNDLSENSIDWDLFSGQVDEYALVRTSTSCPFSCAFCGYPSHAGRYRTASLEAVEKELNGLDKIKSLKHITFIDGTPNIPPKRYKKILKMIQKNNYHFKWNSNLRCQFLDRETAELMKETGCDGVYLGIESGSNKILNNMNKAVTVEEYYKAIEMLNKYDIPAFGCFVLGFPGETDETVQETMKFIKESGIGYFRIQLWYYEVIAPISKRKEEFKLTGSNFEWSHATMDSKRASEIIDDIFLTIDDPIWVPQYNFDFNGLLQHMIYRGYTPEEVNNFIRAFNDGIREKLSNPSQKDISFELALELKKICQKSDYFDEDSIAMLLNRQ